MPDPTNECKLLKAQRITYMLDFTNACKLSKIQKVTHSCAKLYQCVQAVRNIRNNSLAEEYKRKYSFGSQKISHFVKDTYSSYENTARFALSRSRVIMLLLRARDMAVGNAAFYKVPCYL